MERSDSRKQTENVQNTSVPFSKYGTKNFTKTNTHKTDTELKTIGDFAMSFKSPSFGVHTLKHTTHCHSWQRVCLCAAWSLAQFELHYWEMVVHWCWHTQVKVIFISLFFFSFALCPDTNSAQRELSQNVAFKQFYFEFGRNKLLGLLLLYSHTCWNKKAVVFSCLQNQW